MQYCNALHLKVTFPKTDLDLFLFLTSFGSTGVQTAHIFQWFSVVCTAWRLSSLCAAGAVLLWYHWFQIHPLLKHVISCLSGWFLVRLMPIVKSLALWDLLFGHRLHIAGSVREMFVWKTNGLSLHYRLRAIHTKPKYLSQYSLSVRQSVFPFLSYSLSLYQYFYTVP